MMNDGNMKECITACWECRTACHETLFAHCLQEGGEHMDPAHVKVMTDCIQICQTAADFMTRNSAEHAAVCAACADICSACAESCAKMDTPEMKVCADACRRCAQNCSAMGQMRRKAA